MSRDFTTAIRPAIVMTLLFAALLGLAYPALLTGIGQLAFPAQANGSLIREGGRVIGSSLIGQNFDAPNYFWGRLSATAPNPDNGTASGGSNYGPLNPALADAVKARIAALRDADPDATLPVPADLVMASASGLDPDISPAAAAYQIARVAKARNMAPEAVQALVARHTSGRQWGIFGEPRVNVLRLNMALDESARGGVR